MTFNALTATIIRMEAHYKSLYVADDGGGDNGERSAEVAFKVIS